MASTPVTVRDSGDGTGPYSFRLLDLASAPTLPLNVPVNDILDPVIARTVSVHRFGGQRLFLSLAGRQCLRLLRTRWTRRQGGRWELPGVPRAGDADGEWDLQPLRDRHRRQPHYLHIRGRHPPTTSAPLGWANAISGTLAQPGQIDDFTFTGSVGQRLYFDGLAANPGLSATLTARTARSSSTPRPVQTRGR